MTDRPIFRGPDGRTLSPDEVAALLREMVGQRLPGGCDDCTAEHELVEAVPDIFDMFLYHQETCPTLRPDP